MPRALHFAVFGHPISHSLSPQIHQAFARQFGITLTYRPINVVPEAFAEGVRRFFTDQDSRGANVTLPHKSAAFALADERTQAAMRAGTANVLSRLAHGGLSAHNTDGAALIRDLTERHGVDVRDHDVLLLGAGGAARAAAWSLIDAGVRTLTIVNRSSAAAIALADAIGEPARARHWEDLPRSGRFGLVVNATSAGTLGQSLDLPFSLIGMRGSCYDLSYGKSAIAFLDWARASGAPHACDGLGMLVEQAADAFEMWHGKRPATEQVYQLLRTQSTRR